MFPFCNLIFVIYLQLNLLKELVYVSAIKNIIFLYNFKIFLFGLYLHPTYIDFFNNSPFDAENNKKKNQNRIQKPNEKPNKCITNPEVQLFIREPARKNQKIILEQIQNLYI